MILLKDWDGRYQVTELPSAYSTMVMQADGDIAFFYEEDKYKTVGGGYAMVYKNLTVDLITGGQYSLR